MGRLKAQDPDLGDNALMAYSILDGEGSEAFSISTDSQGQDGLLTVRKVSFLPVNTLQSQLGVHLSLASAPSLPILLTSFQEPYLAPLCWGLGVIAILPFIIISYYEVCHLLMTTEATPWSPLLSTGCTWKRDFALVSWTHPSCPIPHSLSPLFIAPGLRDSSLLYLPCGSYQHTHRPSLPAARSLQGCGLCTSDCAGCSRAARLHPGHLPPGST